MSPTQEPVRSGSPTSATVGGLRVGDHIDALDTSQTWLIARVLEIDERAYRIYIRYEGWGDKWREWIQIPHRRLAPYRSHSIQRSNITNKPFNLRVEEKGFISTVGILTSICDKLNELSVSASSSQPPPSHDILESEEISLSLGVYSKVSFPFPGLNQPLFTLLSADDYSFLTSGDNLKFADYVMNSFPEDSNVQVLMFQYVQMNMKLAIYAMLTEKVLHPGWCDICFRLLGGIPCFLYAAKEKTLGGLPDFQSLRNTDEDSSVTSLTFTSSAEFREHAFREHAFSTVQAYFMKFFAKHGGFIAFAKQLMVSLNSKFEGNDQREYQLDPNFYLSTSKFPVQFGWIQCYFTLLRALCATKEYLVRPFLSAYVALLKLPHQLELKIMRSVDEDIKMFDTEAYEKLVEFIYALHQSAAVPNTPHLYDFKEMITLVIGIRMITSKVLQTQLMGITVLENQITKVSTPTHNFLDFNSQHLLRWVGNYKVVDSILGRDSHEQMVKRSLTLLKFLALHNQLQPVHIDLLWSTVNGKHEGFYRTVYDLLAELAQVLNEDLLDSVSVRLSEKPLGEYKDYDIAFLRNFSVNAVRSRVEPVPLKGKEKSDRNPDQGKWYGLEILWQITQSSNMVSPSISSAASSSLAFLLAFPEFRSQLTVYLDKCLSALQSSTNGSGVTSSNALPSLQLAQLIIEKQPDEPLVKQRSVLIASLESDRKILNLLVESIVAYEKIAILTISVSPVGSDPIINGHKHSLQLTARFNFLTFLLSSTKLQLSQTQIDSLWNAFLSTGVPLSESATLFNWLTAAVDGKSAKDKKDKDPPLFPLKLSRYIFSDLLGNQSKLDYGSLTYAAYNCLEAFFVHINYSLDMLYTPSRLAVTVTGQMAKLVGLDALLDIATLARDEQVVSASMQFVTTLYLRMSFDTPLSSKRPIIRGFIDKCLSVIHQKLGPVDAISSVPTIKGKDKDSKKRASKNSKDEKSKSNNQNPISSNKLTPGSQFALLSIIAILDLFVTRLIQGHLLQKPRFVVGQTIRATWKAQLRLYGAMVEAVNPDGTYRVKYDDGDLDEFTPERNLHALERRDKREMDKSDATDGDESVITRSWLVNESKHFEVLFRLLGVNSIISARTMDLLSKLPVNRELSETIRTLGQSPEIKDGKTILHPMVIDWNVLFPNDAVPRLMYTLRIVKQFALIPTPPTTIQNSQHSPTSSLPSEVDISHATSVRWCEQFAAKEGFVHLYHLFVDSFNLDGDEFDSLHLDCLSILCELISNFLHLSGKIPSVIDVIDPPKLAAKLLAVCRAALDIRPGSEPIKNALTSPYSNVTSPPPPPPVMYGPNLPNTVGVSVTITAPCPPMVPEPYVQDERINLITSCLLSIQLLEQLHLNDISSTLLSSQDWDNIIKNGIFNSNPSIRESVNVGFKLLTSESMQLLNHILAKLLACLRTMAMESYATVCSEYFQLLGDMMQFSQGTTISTLVASENEMDNGISKMKDVDSVDSDLLEFVLLKIKQLPMMETSMHIIDPMLCGLLSLAYQLLKKTSSDKRECFQDSVNDLLQCLFKTPTSSSRAEMTIQPPKCKSRKSRELAYHVLSELAYDCPSNTSIIAQFLLPFHVEVPAVNHFQNWNYEPRSEEKPSCGYLGLQNLGCTCYMNAPLQQFYMIPQLRQALMSIDEYKETDMVNSLLYQTQYLYAMLQESEQSSCSPEGFCYAFKDLDGKPTDVRVQDDSGLFAQKLIDRLCMLTKGTKYERAIPAILGGVLCHELIGKGECTHYRERGEDFYGLSIEVQNKKTLHESLQAFVEGELLEGGNAYKCDECSKKVDTLKRTCIKSLPSTIFFVLKRFALDYNTMETTKINDRLEFPTYLDMKPYCKDTLGQKSTRGPAATEASPSDNDDLTTPIDSSSPNGSLENTTPSESGEILLDEHYQYVVRGIVVHTGSANGGHYYSFCQSRVKVNDDDDDDGARDGCYEGGEWYKFNDSVVTPFDPKDIPDECFGGVEDAPVHNMKLPQQGGNTTYEKYRNAYLLFYDRISLPKQKQTIVPSETLSSQADTNSTKTNGNGTLETKAKDIVKVNQKEKRTRGRSTIPPTMYDEIWRFNLAYFRERVVYDEQYFQFLFTLVKSGYKLQSRQDSHNQLLLIELATKFVLLVLGHYRYKDSLKSWFELLSHMYGDEKSSNIFLLEMLTANESHLAVSYLIQCQDRDARIGVKNLVCQALSTLVPTEEWNFDTPHSNGLEEEAPESKLEKSDIQLGICARFIDSLLQNFSRIPTYWRWFAEYFSVLAHFASIHPLAAQWMIKKYNLLARSMDFILSQLSIHKELNDFPLNNKGDRVKMRDDLYYPDLSPFWALVSALITVSKQPAVLPAEFGSPEIQIPQLCHSPGLIDLSPHSISLLLYTSIDNGMLVHLMQSATGKRVTSSLCAITRHLCFNNIPVSKAIIATIERGLQFFEWDFLSSYFRIIDNLVQFQDDIQKERVELMMEMLINVTIRQSQFWKLTDYCIEHIIRLCSISPLASSYVSTHAADVEPLLIFLENNPDPPTVMRHYSNHQHVPSRVQLLRPQSAYSSRNPALLEPFGRGTREKLVLLENLSRGDIVDIGEIVDSDVDFTDRGFQLGDRVDYHDRDRWITAQVSQIQEEERKVLLEFMNGTEKESEWVDFSSPGIRKLGSFTNRQAK